MHLTTALPRLFLKPQPCDRKLFTKHLHEHNSVLTVQFLNIEDHLPTIHQWVNAAYARFWQMYGPYEDLEKAYRSIQDNPYAHSFVVFCNGKLVCQADLYLIGASELSSHLPDDCDQCGIHIILAPPAEHPFRHLSLHCLSCLLQYYFSFPQAKKIYGEPDHRNEKVHLLIKRAGFSFLRQVQLSDKTANLFVLERGSFLKATSPGQRSWPPPQEGDMERGE